MSDIIATILAYVIIFGWIPYSGYCMGRAARWVLLPPRKPKKKKSTEVKAVAPPRKPNKRSYPVETSYDEKYRITNPVEFDT